MAAQDPFFVVATPSSLCLKLCYIFQGQMNLNILVIGATTSAAAANIPDHLIKLLGRWSSDCYQRYIRTPPAVLSYALNVIADT